MDMFLISKLKLNVVFLEQKLENGKVIWTWYHNEEKKIIKS